jgi:hypothetical protein
MDEFFGGLFEFLLELCFNSSINEKGKTAKRMLRIVFCLMVCAVVALLVCGIIFLAKDNETGFLLILASVFVILIAIVLFDQRT